MAVGCWPVTADTQVLLQASPYGICGEQNSNGMCFPPTTSVFPYQYHTTNVLYLLITANTKNSWL
jgi:hypothetical protein